MQQPTPLSAPTALVPAAQYVRVSTEHQQYSTENQREAIAEYAKAKGYEIVKTYADDGKSGLRIEGRRALQQMLADVQGGDSAVLDVVHKADWERLGVLLGGQDAQLGAIVAVWPVLSPRQRAALIALTERS